MTWYDVRPAFGTGIENVILLLHRPRAITVLFVSSVMLTREFNTRILKPLSVLLLGTFSINYFFVFGLHGLTWFDDEFTKIVRLVFLNKHRKLLVIIKLLINAESMFVQNSHRCTCLQLTIIWAHVRLMKVAKARQLLSGHLVVFNSKPNSRYPKRAW